MPKSAIVLGAGMVGVCTAYHLSGRGLDVALVDRKAPGSETSYGNAGIIQREAVEPAAFPGNLSTLLQIALGRSNAVHYKVDALPSLLGPLARYWWMSGGPRYERLSSDYARLIAHAIDEHAVLIEASGASDLIRKSGWRRIFQSSKELEKHIAIADKLRQIYGVESIVQDTHDLAKSEPCLQSTMAGAIRWTQPWTCLDPGVLVQRYCDLLVKRGGKVFIGDAATLQSKGSGWVVETAHGAQEAELVVVALGPWSAAFTRKWGYRLPLFLQRGYHRHYSYEGPPVNVPLLHNEGGFLLAPMSMGLRLTTGIELSRAQAGPSPTQLEEAEKRVRSLIQLNEPLDDVWTGSRPCMVDMLPVLGCAPRHPNMWFHFGHGPQGFTLGPATARLLSELITGEAPFTDPCPYSPARFEQRSFPSNEAGHSVQFTRRNANSALRI